MNVNEEVLDRLSKTELIYYVHENVKHMINVKIPTELSLLDLMDVSYEITFDETNFLYKTSMNIRNIAQLKTSYKGYDLYLFLNVNYPYRCPVMMINPVSYEDEKYNISEGMKETKIGHLDNILDIVHQYYHNDKPKLVDIREFAKTMMNEEESDNYYKKLSTFYHNTLHIIDIIKIMREPIC